MRIGSEKQKEKREKRAERNIFHTWSPKLSEYHTSFEKCDIRGTGK